MRRPAIEDEFQSKHEIRAVASRFKTVGEASRALDGLMRIPKERLWGLARAIYTARYLDLLGEQKRQRAGRILWRTVE